jgi:LacI family transcriptional regulator
MADRAMHREPRPSGLSIGFMTFNKTRDDWRGYSSPRLYFEGASRRAAELGYRLDAFWLSDPDIPTQRMEAILRTRNVQGLLFAPPPEADVLGVVDCSPFACVGLELHAALPAVHRVVPDQKHGWWRRCSSCAAGGTGASGWPSAAMPTSAPR